MHNRHILEHYYKKFTSDIQSYLPEGIIDVDLALLNKLNLLNYYDPNSSDPGMTRYFHVIESEEKITLVNEEFIVWIVPEKGEEENMTYALIALKKPDQIPLLEMCFVASGVYNSSRLVLRVLEKFLHEIHESEVILKKMSTE